jgi:hypothetical protein
MFLTKLENYADLDQVKKDLETILTKTEWGVDNQIGLTHRTPPLKDPWKDCVGSIYNRATGEEVFKETDFLEFNTDVPEYLKSLLLDFAQQHNFKLGRVRLMRLLPKTGLTVHRDTSVRYHLVLETNPYSYIAHTFEKGNIAALCLHIPADSTFYKVDTTVDHFVYNGGLSPRIHLVICPLPLE